MSRLESSSAKHALWLSHSFDPGLTECSRMRSVQFGCRKPGLIYCGKISEFLANSGRNCVAVQESVYCPRAGPKGRARCRRRADYDRVSKWKGAEHTPSLPNE